MQFLIRRETLGALLTLGALIHVGWTHSASAAVFPVSSNFDTGLDGWTGNATWSASGGNPGGYAQLVQGGPAPTDIIAPATYHGDWSSLNGVGTIAFSHRLFNTGPDIDRFFPYSVELAGPGGIARWTGQTPTGATPWLSMSVPLDSSQWAVSSGTWISLLGDVESFRVRIELVSNFSGADSAGIDNVSVSVPEPGSAFLLLLPLLFALGRRRPA